MNYTDSDIAYLRSFRNNLDYDGIKVKQQIKKMLLNNKHIIHVLNNKELEEAEAEPDDYYGVNIIPYIMRFIMETLCQKLSNCWKHSLSYQYQSVTI